MKKLLIENNPLIERHYTRNEMPKEKSVKCEDIPHSLTEGEIFEKSFQRNFRLNSHFEIGIIAVSILCILLALKFGALIAGKPF